MFPKIYGEEVVGFSIPVLNERAVRAGAGLLFAFAEAAFLLAFVTGSLAMLKLLVIVFLLDFTIRMVSPLYAPTLIMGAFLTRRQKPEYVGAMQKRFAWGIGLTLAVLMFISLFVLGSVGPLNFLLCIVCLLFLFAESALGVCLGCALHERLFGTKAQLCPGGVCDDELRVPYTPRILHGAVLVASFAIIIAIALSGVFTDKSGALNTGHIKTNCDIPAWVVKIGHEDQWRLHHGCE